MPEGRVLVFNIAAFSVALLFFPCSIYDCFRLWFYIFSFQLECLPICNRWIFVSTSQWMGWPPTPTLNEMARSTTLATALARTWVWLITLLRSHLFRKVSSLYTVLSMTINGYVLIDYYFIILLLLLLLCLLTFKLYCKFLSYRDLGLKGVSCLSFPDKLLSTDCLLPRR